MRTAARALQRGLFIETQLQSLWQLVVGSPRLTGTRRKWAHQRYDPSRACDTCLSLRQGFLNPNRQRGGNRERVMLLSPHPFLANLGVSAVQPTPAFTWLGGGHPVGVLDKS